MNNNLIDAASPKFTSWQKEIVFDKGRHGDPEARNRHVWEPIRARQEALQSAVKGGHEKLGAYLRQALHIGQEAIGAPEFPRSELTPDECQNPPIELERELWAAWSELKPRLASRPVYWLLCHVEWIEQGRFGKGGHQLEAALGSRRGKDWEAKTRNVLRHTGGIPHERGKTSVFSDCPLARAWWRGHLADQVALVARARMSSEEAHRVLHANRPAWETLARLGIQRVTVISQPKARAAIVSQLKARLCQHGRLGPADVLEVATRFARLGLRWSLEHMPWQGRRA